MSAAERQQRRIEADALCQRAYRDCGGPTEGVALIAVGGYGRGELAPYSDLDLVLVHAGSDIGGLGQDLWYPLWDSHTKIDHAVRSEKETMAAARSDLKVAMGLLDARHVAGDAQVTMRVRATLLAEWRTGARKRLRELSELVGDRHQRLGELAHIAVPDIKEAEGGLRDATVLKALTATWIVDVPHTDLEHSRQALLDLRDTMHTVAGRGTDRITPELWAPLAAELGLEDSQSAQRVVRETGRRLTHLSRLTWRRVEELTHRRVSFRGARRPQLTRVSPGIAISRGEVVLERGAPVSTDPTLLLRAAAEAADRNLLLAPTSAARLVRDGARLPTPWPGPARQALVRMLAGPGLLTVWETLEETSAIEMILPEWERIRLLPHATAIHRFTVDRHVIETCLEAAAGIRDVARPDVLLVAALLHDIGKGGRIDHSVAGEPIARQIAHRMGFDAEAVAQIARLVRWHLVLSETATTRDPEDPTTLAYVGERVADTTTLTLLRVLTEADAKATSRSAWTSWRARLVDQLAGGTHAALEAAGAGEPAPQAVEIESAIPDGVAHGLDTVALQLIQTDDGEQLTVFGRDRVGLLADVAGALALQRVGVRAARAWSQGDIAVSQWQVDAGQVQPQQLRERILAIMDGRLDPAQRLSPTARTGLSPAVSVRPEASQIATVLEVRVRDQRGVIYLVCAALARLDITVRSAHLDTLGPQAVDVLYLQQRNAGALPDDRAAQAAHVVRDVLSGG